MLERLFLLCLAVLMPCVAQAASARVFVLATLHSMHEKVPGYGYEALGRAIESLAPDVLCLEIRPKDLEKRGPEGIKKEYPRVIYPLIARHQYRLYAMEPAEPTYSEIVKPYAAAEQQFGTAHPAQAEAFNAYAEDALNALVTYWTTPAHVNDAVTDAVYAGKHALQEAMIGPGERKGWEAWNQHFLAVIKRAAQENPGRTIVVTVGVEHTYWLRAHLKDAPGIVLADTAAAISAASGTSSALSAGH